jgi:hypothetical protein
MNAKQINEWVECFEKNKKLPEKQVPCSKCDSKVTMWSTNLTNRLTKFRGIRDLLTNFTCRDCGPKKAKVAVVVKAKAPKVKKEIVVIEPVVSEVKETKYNRLPAVKSGTVIDLVVDAEYCKIYTEGACVRPDIFLDNDRSCNKCRLYENCRASCRRLANEKARFDDNNHKIKRK